MNRVKKNRLMVKNLYRICGILIKWGYGHYIPMINDGTSIVGAPLYVDLLSARIQMDFDFHSNWSEFEKGSTMTAFKRYKNRRRASRYGGNSPDIQYLHEILFELKEKGYGDYTMTAEPYLNLGYPIPNHVERNIDFTASTNALHEEFKAEELDLKYGSTCHKEEGAPEKRYTITDWSKYEEELE